MRIECEHGLYRFYPDYPAEIFDFNDFYEQELEWNGRYFTFGRLVNAPRYSLVGKAVLGVNATQTFEGRPEDVLRQNKLVYHIADGVMKTLASVTESVVLDAVGGEFLASSALVQAGAIAGSQKVLSYDGRLNVSGMELRISSVEYG